MKSPRQYTTLAIALVIMMVILACGAFGTNAPVENPVTLPVATNRQESTTGLHPVAAFTQPAIPQEPLITTNEEAILIELYKQINPSVVNIIVYVAQENLVAPEGQGSGFLYDAEGDIVTNSHVVHGADELEVVFPDGSIQKGKVLGEDLHSDLAVIKVDKVPSNAQPIPLGKMEQVAVGQTVVAIGNPFGLGGTLTRGIVSALGRTIPALTSFSIPQAIQTDAPINPGNSGGPLLNLKGELIGVNAQIETGGGSRANSGVGFAIPVSIVQRVIPALIKDGEFQWGWIGVVGGSISPATIEAMDLSVDRGAYISQIVPGGPADQAGLRGSDREMRVGNRVVEVGGDIIIAIDGIPVSSFDDILIYIAINTTPGQEVTLTVVRDGKEKQVVLTLRPRPQETGNFTNP